MCVCLSLLLVWPVNRSQDNRVSESEEEFEWLRRTRDVRRYVLPDAVTAILHPNVSCGDATRILILVASAPSNAEQRQAVRETWGCAAHSPDTTLLFFLGHDGNNWPPRTTVREAAIL